MAGVYAKAESAVGDCTDSPRPSQADARSHEQSQSGSCRPVTVTNPPSDGRIPSTYGGAGHPGRAEAAELLVAVYVDARRPSRRRRPRPSSRAATIASSASRVNAVTGINATGSTNVNLGCGMITNSASQNAAVATGSSDVRKPDRSGRRHSGEQQLGRGNDAPAIHVRRQIRSRTCRCADVRRLQRPGRTSRTIKPERRPVPMSTASSVLQRRLTSRATDLEQAIYFIDGAGLNRRTPGASHLQPVHGHLSTSGTRRRPTDRQFRISMGAPQMHWTAPATGTYTGLLIYQDRRARPANNNYQRSTATALRISRARSTSRSSSSTSRHAGMNTNCLQLVVAARRLHRQQRHSEHLPRRLRRDGASQASG